MTLVGFPFFPRFFFSHESLTTFKKAAAAGSQQISILDAGYQWDIIFTITLSYNSLKSKSWFIFIKISGYTPLKNRQDFEYTQYK